MRAPRQFLAWLWAAVWLRWRIVGVKTRRLLGRRPVAAAGMGYHLAAADIPVEGVDYDPTELPAGLAARLEETRGELLDLARSTAARRTRRRRARRRRTFSLATAALVTLAILGAGATALVTGSTGVPAVDRYLGLYEAGLERPQERTRLGPGRPDVRPAPSGAGPSIDVPFADGSRRIVVASYVARGSDICSVVTEADRAADSGDVGCVAPVFLNARVQRDGGIVSGLVSDRDAVLLLGFVEASAERLTARGPNGPLRVRLGDLWAPDLAGLRALRPFVALAADGSPAWDRSDFVVRVRADNGKVTEIEP